LHGCHGQSRMKGDKMTNELAIRILTGDVLGTSGQTQEAVKMAVKALSSAQPEPLTDKEQRIFLAAMGREEKVCKQVDEECRDCREPYEDSLVRVCHEIERKVKGALWMI